jgi:type II secretory pathway pseudopilin PulG
MLIVAGLLARLRDRSGFTLVETIVAMVTGVIVTGALFAILEVSTRQSAHLSNVSQATQISRNAMTKVVDQLRSACLSSGFAPVIEKSTPNKLIFVNGYDEKTSKSEEPPAELPASGIRKDVVEYNEKTKVLEDKTYVATSSTPTEKPEKYSFGALPTGTVKLAENVSRVEEGGVEQPVFKYFPYAKTSNTATGSSASTLDEKESLTPKSTSELTEAGAANVASVVVQFRTAPPTKEFRQNATVEKNTFADQTSQTIFAFSAPNSETTIEAKPCE